jgi:hypothetical protein
MNPMGKLNAAFYHHAGASYSVTPTTRENPCTDTGNCQKLRQFVGFSDGQYTGLGWLRLMSLGIHAVQHHGVMVSLDSHLAVR